MSKIVNEYDAKIALLELERETKALSILNKAESKLPYYLISSVGTGICGFFVNSSGFEAPVIVRTILICSLLIGVLNLIDAGIARRKLDAAIALLLIQEKRRAAEDGGKQ